MRDPKNELRGYLMKLIDQLFFIKGLRNQLKIIDAWENPKKIETLNIGWYFFRLVTYSFNRTIMIELCKLFSDKEDKSIIDWLKKVKEHSVTVEPTKYNQTTGKRDVINEVDYHKVIDRHFVVIESRKEILENVNGMRDKFLVHSDAAYFNNPHKSYEKFPLNNQEIDDLLSTATDILEIHYLHLMQSDLEIEVHSPSNVDAILWHTRAFKRAFEDEDLKDFHLLKYKWDDYNENDIPKKE